MKLVTFETDGRQGLGLVDDDGGVRDIGGVDGIPGDMSGLIAAGPAALERVAAAVAEGHLREVAEPRLLAPIPDPVRDILCVGKNYFDHAHEFHGSGFDSGAAGAVPDHPIVFTKATTSVVGPGDAIPASDDPTGSVDYEGEFAVVIGTGGRHIAKANAYDHVFGYTIVNDVTSRELQKRHAQWVIGKGIDGFCPMGPWLVTADETGDPGPLRLRTEVNGETRQDAPIGDLIFDIPTLIETLSRFITLIPGDIIATGTPTGVGIGFEPPRYLQPGDVVSITVNRLGTLTNPVA